MTLDTTPSHSIARNLFSSDFGVPVKLMEDFYLVRIPLPQNPLKALNSYFILEGDKTVIIDVGFNRDDCEEVLRKAMRLLNRSWDNVEVILTHSHADHSGNMSRIYRDGMKVWANFPSYTEVEKLQIIGMQVFHPLLRKAEMRRLKTSDPSTVPAKPPVSHDLLVPENPPKVTFIGQGDVYRVGRYTFQVTEVPGHDAWHICLYEPTYKIMLVGDHVLETITPTISAWDPAQDSLGDFFRSLQKIRHFDVEWVLPAHGAAFTSFRERIDELIEHHRSRVEEIYELVEAGNTDIISISSKATWYYADWWEWKSDQKLFSIAETLAHLIYLEREGRLKRIEGDDEYCFGVSS